MSSRKEQEVADRSKAIDRLLVEGELVIDDNGNEVRSYPKSIDVAARVGVTPGYVSKYAKQNRCFQRRTELREAVDAKVRDGLAKRQAKRIIYDKDRMLSVIDQFLEHYEECLKTKDIERMKAADVNMMMRLRRFVESESDSRREAPDKNLTLEDLQKAHIQMLADMQKMTPAECGMDSLLPARRKNPRAASTDDSFFNGEIHQEVEH